MSIDQRGHTAGAAVRDGLADVVVPPADATLRRLKVRHRRTVATLIAFGLVAVLSAVAVRDSSSSTRVRTATPGPADLPAGSRSDSGWASIPKQTAGIGASASVDVLTSTGSALIAGGTPAVGAGGDAALWRSTDGLHWSEPGHPASTGSVTAVGAHGSSLLAVGTTATGLNQPANAFVWSSLDDGRSWTAVASGADVFGPPAPQMGRPFVTGLRWSDAGFWIATGGASDGYAGIWTSPDGARWTSALPPGNGAGSADVVDDGQGDLLAYWTSLAWSSVRGDTWTPVSLAVPSPYFLTAVAPGAALAVGSDGNHTTPAPLLRSRDAGRTWTIDTRFLDQFPDAVGLAVGRYDGVSIIAGFAGQPNHVDAWASTDETNWHPLPAALKATPGGILRLTASIGNTIVVMGSAPELDHYFTLDTSTVGAPPASTQCPQSVPRRLVDGGSNVSADALPYIDNATTDRAHVAQVLAANTQSLTSYQGYIRAEVGPGFGRAWTGQNGGQYQVVNVDDYAIIVHLDNASNCPQGVGLYTSIQDVPLFFVVDT